MKKYTYRLDKIAAFSDDLRDGIKGSVFEPKDKGFASGKKGMEESVKFGIVAATPLNSAKKRCAEATLRSTFLVSMSIFGGNRGML